MLLTALQPYEIPVFDFEEWDVQVNGMYICVQARFKVPAEQAEWAEYLIYRSKNFVIAKGNLNYKNKRWAAKYQSMPNAWRPRQSAKNAARKGNSGIMAWHEAGCPRRDQVSRNV